MALAQLEVEIINKVQNIGALAEEKAALSGALGGGGFSPLGGGTVNFGGSLTKGEQTAAAAQMAEIESKAKSAGVGLKEFQSAGGLAGGEAASLTGKLGALGALGFTPAGAAILGAVVALEAGVEVGKSWLENADKQEAATKNLEQAFGTLGEKVPNKALDEFLQKNARFIPNMYDAENALAALARAGFEGSMQFRLLNDALDMSAITGASVSDSATVLIKAHEGQARSLAQFGISLKEVQVPAKALEEAHKEVTKATEEHTKAVRALDEWEVKHKDRSSLTQYDLMREQDLKNRVTQSTKDLTAANFDQTYAQNLVKEKGDQYLALLDTLEPKIRGARNNVSELQQSQNELGQSWDRLSNVLGPPLEKTLSSVFTDVSDFITAVSKFNADDWKGLKQLGDFFHGLGSDIQTADKNFNAWMVSMGVTPAAAQQNIQQATSNAASRQRGFSRGRMT